MRYILIFLFLLSPVQAVASDSDFVKNLLTLSEQGNAQADFTLAGLYVNGDGVSKNVKKALELYHSSAEDGFIGSQVTLGLIYESGLHGMSQDFEQAFHWYSEAAKQEEAFSQYSIAAMYKHGRGVQKDMQKSFFWAEKSAKNGEKQAQTLLASLYYEGDGTLQDYDAALKWFKKAAKQGDDRAQALLGVMYFEGKGAKKDKETAYAWLNVAASKNPSVKTLREHVAKTMNSDELKRAQDYSKELASLYSQP